MAPKFEGHVILVGDSKWLWTTSWTNLILLSLNSLLNKAVHLHNYCIIMTNPTSWDYSNFSRAHNHYSRIENVFLPSGLQPKLLSDKIILTPWSDHDPILVTLSNMTARLAKPCWKLNESLLVNESYCLLLRCCYPSESLF